MRFILVALTLLAATTGHARAAGQDIAPSSRAAADATLAEVALVPYAAIVRDEAKTKTVREVLVAAPTQAPARDHKVFGVGFSAAAYWLVLPVENKQERPLQRLILFDPPWLDDVRVSLIGPQGEDQHFEGGDTRPFAQRSEPNRKINFLLTVPPGRSTLVIRLETRDPFFADVKLIAPTALGDSDATESMYFGLIYGGLGCLLLFNFVLFMSSREKTYLAYSVMLAAFMLMHAAYNGHMFRWVLPRYPNASNWGTSFLIHLYCCCGLIFASIFLDLKARLPGAHVWSRRLLYLIALSFVGTALLGGYRVNGIASILWVVLFSVNATALGLLSLRRHNAAAMYYLSASMAGLLGSFVTAFTVMGILPYTFVTFRAVDFGMLVDAIMLSLALSARVTQTRRLERLRRFFSPAVADRLLSATSDELYRPHQREIVVLFVDLRGYTAFTLTHSADEVMRVLGEFHKAIGELIGSYEATLERFAGDGMMIFLNDPVEIPDAALKAAEMALEMQERFQSLNEIWERRGYQLAMGVGIAQGLAVIGAIGFEGRRDYAAIGNVTNLAARLCSEAHGGQILISSVVAVNISGAVPVREIGALPLKGFIEPVDCYEISLPARQAPAQIARARARVAA